MTKSELNKLTEWLDSWMNRHVYSTWWAFLMLIIFACVATYNGDHYGSENKCIPFGSAKVRNENAYDGRTAAGDLCDKTDGWSWSHFWGTILDHWWWLAIFGPVLIIALNTLIAKGRIKGGLTAYQMRHKRLEREKAKTEEITSLRASINAMEEAEGYELTVWQEA